MNGSEIQSLAIKLLIMGLTPYAMKAGIDGNTLTSIVTWAASGAVLAYGIYSHWNMKIVPEHSTAVALGVVPGVGSSPLPVGGTVQLANGGAVKVVGAILLGLIVLHSAPAFAQLPKVRPLTGNIERDFGKGATTLDTKADSALVNALAKPFQDLAAFLSSDAATAIALSTQIPALQDGHGQQCWIAMSTAGDVFKAHPVPLTLHAMTDVEALRLLAMTANNLCVNVHCTQVFADLGTMAQAASPMPLPIPSLHDLCSKIPQIAQVAPATPPATAVPAAPVTPAQP